MPKRETVWTGWVGERVSCVCDVDMDVAFLSLEFLHNYLSFTLPLTIPSCPIAIPLPNVVSFSAALLDDDSAVAASNLTGWTCCKCICVRNANGAREAGGEREREQGRARQSVQERLLARAGGGYVRARNNCVHITHLGLALSGI